MLSSICLAAPLLCLYLCSFQKKEQTSSHLFALQPLLCLTHSPHAPKTLCTFAHWFGHNCFEACSHSFSFLLQMINLGQSWQEITFWGSLISVTRHAAWPLLAAGSCRLTQERRRRSRRRRRRTREPPTCRYWRNCCFCIGARRQKWHRSVEGFLE